MPTSEDICELCGEPLPKGEEMFRYHGYSCPCPKPPLQTVTEPDWQQQARAAGWVPPERNMKQVGDEQDIRRWSDMFHLDEDTVKRMMQQHQIVFGTHLCRPHCSGCYLLLIEDEDGSSNVFEQIRKHRENILCEETKKRKGKERKG